jgi:excisionase family DNA binding protein
MKSQIESTDAGRRELGRGAAELPPEEDEDLEEGDLGDDEDDEDEDEDGEARDEEEDDNFNDEGDDEEDEDEDDEMIAEERPKPRSLDDLPEVILADEVAEVCRVNRKTIYDAVRNRELPGVRLGRLLRFYRADVVDWLRGNGSVPRSSRRRK